MNVNQPLSEHAKRTIIRLILQLNLSDKAFQQTLDNFKITDEQSLIQVKDQYHDSGTNEPLSDEDQPYLICLASNLVTDAMDECNVNGIEWLSYDNHLCLMNLTKYATNQITTFKTNIK